MATLGVCIEPCFGDLDYRSRIEAIARIGFRHYDLWFHNAGFNGAALTDEVKDFDMIAEMNDKHGLVTTSFVHCHPDGGVKASLINRRDRNKVLDTLGETMLPLARRIGCRGLVSGSGNVSRAIGREEAIESMIETLVEAARIVEPEGVTILLEPWNNVVDHPQVFLSDPQLSVDVVRAVNHPNVKLLYDIYHMQIMGGNVMSFIRDNLDCIGHFQLAGVPGRHEPVDNELDYRYILRETEKLGYTGVFGLEYWPTMESEKSLRTVFEQLGSGT